MSHPGPLCGREIAFSSDLQPGIGGGNQQGKNTNGLKIQLEGILSTLSISRALRICLQQFNYRHEQIRVCNYHKTNLNFVTTKIKTFI